MSKTTIVGELFVIAATIIGFFYVNWSAQWELAVQFFSSVPTIYYILFVSGIILQVIGAFNRDA